MARQHRDVEEIRIMERATKVHTYRLIGYTQREIAEKLGISIDTVRRDIERLKVDYPQQTVKELVAEQNQKLIQMMKPHYIRACKGDIKATDMMLKLMDHQAKLFGAYDVKPDDGQASALDKLGALIDAVRASVANEDLDASD